jgi:putative PIG3 family NAD(P)H quinone oxidoreductase
MRAVLAPEPGGPDALVVLDRPTPVAAAGEVLIEVVAAGINRADIAQREGHYPPPTGASDVLGLEVSGRIAALGDGVRSWAVGDEVCALLAGGGYAEVVAVAAGQVLAKPAAVSLVDAAGLPETTCTVWSNVVGVGRLSAGEWLLVHGGSSGIGTTAIQIGKALGAKVAVTAGSAAKLARCRELGADVTVDYTSQDFVEAVRDASGGRGADVVLDIVGAAYLERNVAVLAADGRLVVIGLQKGRRAELDLGALMTKRGTVAATGLRSRPVDQKAAIVDEVRTQVWPMVEAGAVRPIVDRTFPVEQVADAHRLMESSTHIGKILLTF